MISKDSIETAYSFMHQKMRVYIHSLMAWQRDDIEVAISSYVDGMNSELYTLLSCCRNDYLRSHDSFEEDIRNAVSQLERMLEA